MITCHECGRENSDSAVDCANCGNDLQRQTRNEAEEKAADELEAMLHQLDLPDEQADPPPDTRAGPGALATHAETAPVEPAHPLSSRKSPAIRVARIAVAVAVLVSMFAPWGRDAGTIATGWVFALWFTLGSCGMLALLYAGLFLYALSTLQSDHRNWVSWMPRYSKPLLPKGIVEVINRPWVFFWVTRLSLILWLILGPHFILSTNIPDWPLNITWGAWLFLVAIALANAVEGLSLIGWGSKTSNGGWVVLGLVWICLSLVVSPLAIARTDTEPERELTAEDLLSEYRAGERTFDEVVLQNVSLDEAHLPEIQLRDADLRGAHMRRANLHNANLTHAYLFGADMSGVDLGGANLTRVRLGNSSLRGANLSSANLRGALLAHADLSAAQLDEADLREAELLWADLSEANLRGADLTGAILQKASLRSAELDANTEIASKWHLVWEIASHGGAKRDLAGVDLSHAYLVDVDLSEADLSGANLEWAYLRAADLSRADLTGADLSEADLNRVNLRGANLTGATVTDGQLLQARGLEGATLPDGSLHE
jgi:uncharacterized protein YjbI with pentapeptide repeats